MINKLADFNKLKTREKALVIGLAAALGFSVYFQAMYKPLAKNIRRYKFQISKSKSRMGELQAKFPEIEKQMKNIHSLGAECDGLLGRIGEIEKALPSKKGTSRLLTELTKQAEGLKMSSIRRKMEYGEEYSRIFIELKFSAPYENTINYIRRLEAISPFLVIEELDIAEPKEKGSGGSIPAKIMVSTILGDIPVAEQFTAEAAGEDIAVSRDIFVSTSRPATQLRKAEVRLDGITYNEGGSTAIINGDVVREGSEIGKLTVKEIRREEVTLTDGIEDHILTVER